MDQRPNSMTLDLVVAALCTRLTSLVHQITKQRRLPNMERVGDDSDTASRRNRSAI